MRVANAGRGLVIDAPFRITVPMAEWFGEEMEVLGFVRCAPHAGNWSPDWLDLLSAEELGELTDAGFGVGLYQIFRGSRQLTYEHGQAAGEAMVEHAVKIGLPPGVTLWSDCEQFRAEADTLGFLNGVRPRLAYFTESRGIYNGAGFLLPNMKVQPDAREQGEALWNLRGWNLYWDSMSQTYNPSVRGFALGQVWEYVLWGDGPETWWVEEYDPKNPKHKGSRRFDVNRSARDSLGGRMRWAVA